MTDNELKQISKQLESILDVLYEDNRLASANQLQDIIQRLKSQE